MNERMQLSAIKYPFHKNFRKSSKLRRKYHRFCQRDNRAIRQHDKEVEKGNTPIVNINISKHSPMAKIGVFTEPVVFYPDGSVKLPCGDILHGKWIHTMNLIAK